jgi:hypothetical protein
MRKIEQKRIKPRQLENLLILRMRDCNFRKAHRIKFITDCNFLTQMGLLTILKKVKQKEKELRVLILGNLDRRLICLLQIQYFIFLLLVTFLILSYILLYSVGLDNAGKTTCMKRVLGEDHHEISPTVGFNIKTFEYRGLNLNLWDVGGQKSIRTYWRNYFEQTDGIIWVVDSVDRWRLEECKNHLRELLTQEVDR